MQEAQRQNFKDYKSLNDFFTRQLSPLARPIEDSIIVCLFFYYYCDYYLTSPIGVALNCMLFFFSLLLFFDYLYLVDQ
jgi:hypothetical protein